MPEKDYGCITSDIHRSNITRFLLLNIEEETEVGRLVNPICVRLANTSTFNDDE